MIKVLRVLTCLCLLMPFMAKASSTEESLVKAADQARMPDGDVVFKVRVVDFNGKKRIRDTAYRVSVRGDRESLVETVFPARQKGRKLLMKEDDLWFFTPDLRRPTRVSMQQRLTGEVANGDLARTNFAGDYTAKILGEDKVAGKPAYRLELTANRKSVTYSRLLYWISKDSLKLPLKAEFFAASGKPLKRATYSGVKPVLGRPRVTKIVIEDAVKSSSRSELVYSEFKKTPLDASLFNKDSMAD